MPNNLNAFAFESIQLSDSPRGLTQSILNSLPGAAERAFITAEGDCRYTYHPSGEPTSTHGHLFRDGGFIVLTGQLQIQNFKAIKIDTYDSILQVSYERQ